VVDSQGRKSAVRLVDLSATGCRLQLAHALILPPHTLLHLQVFVPALKQQVVLHLRLAWQRGQSIGAGFEPVDLEEKKRVVALAYGDSGRWVAFRHAREAMAHSIPAAAWFLISHGFYGLLFHFLLLSRVALRQSLQIGRDFWRKSQRRAITMARSTRNWLLDQPPTRS